MKTYLVGGAVRDQLLGVDVLDRDWVVVGSSPEAMLHLGYEPVGKDFPVFIDKRTGEEYALARTERKTAKGYHGFSFCADPNVTLEQDLLRRDLTINAMAQDEDGNIIDPYGGQRDLHNGILRHVSMAFIEDPVRVLRTARFAARFNFRIAEETQTLMQTMVADGEVDALVPERIWAEMQKALCCKRPDVFIQALRRCGALQSILPEIDTLFGVPQTRKYHPEVDTGTHTLLVLQQITQLSDDPIVRFAALVHDLGKATTPESILPSHHGHELRGVAIIKQLCQRLRIPKKYQALALAVSEYHLHMHKMFELTPQTILKVLRKTRSLNDRARAEQFALCCLADARGRSGYETREYPQAKLFLQFQQAVSAIDSASLIQQNPAKDIPELIHRAQINAIKTVRTRTTLTPE